MRLTELSAGESGVIETAPKDLARYGIEAGARVTAVLVRKKLFVLEVQGARFALLAKTAGQIIIRLRGA